VTEFAAKLDNAIRASVYRDPDLVKATFGEVAAEWFAAHMRIRDATAPRYDRELRMYMILKFGQRPINTISPADLAAWLSGLLQGTAPARHRVSGSNPPVDLPAAHMRSRLSAASIEHMVTILGRPFTLVGVAGWRNLNPRPLPVGRGLPPGSAASQTTSLTRYDGVAHVALDATGCGWFRLKVDTKWTPSGHQVRDGSPWLHNPVAP
jgi:hypothetical protein